MTTRKPIIGITMGDAAGIGPEIIVKSFLHQELFDKADPIVIGDKTILEKAKLITDASITIDEIKADEIANYDYTRGKMPLINLNLFSEDLEFGKVSPEAGDAAFQYVKKAVEFAQGDLVDAICTAPLNKEALQKGGHMYPGHTEILADLTGTEDYSMMLMTSNLRVIHLTTHMGLIEAIKSITPKRTYDVIKLAHDTLVQSGHENPSIAVCGINPHAGENGLFGDGEEEKQLVPGIEKAQKEGINASGPYPADTLFFRAGRGDFDVVVACYHDQGHTPVKVSGITDGVNTTIGLKGGVIRTSVDHGTAFDIAGKNIATEDSLLAALDAAVDLAPTNS